MYVYGILCSSSDSLPIPNGTTCGVYYKEHGLIVFPSYTKTTCVNSNGKLTNAFWQSVKKITEGYKHVQAVTFEDPYLTDTESTIVNAIQESYPGTSSRWFYLPVF